MKMEDGGMSNIEQGISNNEGNSALSPLTLAFDVSCSIFDIGVSCMLFCSALSARLTRVLLCSMLTLGRESALSLCLFMKDAAAMVSTDLGACEWFVWDLRRSNLVERGQLDQLVGEFLAKNPCGEPPGLAKFLVEGTILTQFQADRLLQGKTQGFVLGPYTLMDALGTGSMGTVYKAKSKNDSDWYAVKVLPRRSMWNVRLARRKVRAFEQCLHPAVVPFVDVGTSGGMHYLAWPLVQGETLDKVVERQGGLRPGLAARYALQVAEGLEACHQQGLFHGFLKPSNLMLGTDGRVRILDFGIGSLLAETDEESLVDTMSTANSVASGLDCSSPESIMDPSNLTAIGDQYSLGCVLYFFLTGCYPFPGGATAEKMLAHQFKEPESIRELAPDVPNALAEVVERLMKKAPEARYSSHAELIEALKPLASDSSDDRATSPLSAAARPTSRPRLEAGQAADTASRSASVTPVIPTRQTLRGAAAVASHSPAQPKQAPLSAPELPTRAPSREPAPAKSPEQAPGPEDTDPYSVITWEDRVGPVGIALSAIVVCALAWLLTWSAF
jgi:serine/threonine-protein kinase